MPGSERGICLKLLPNVATLSLSSKSFASGHSDTSTITSGLHTFTASKMAKRGHHLIDALAGISVFVAPVPVHSVLLDFVWTFEQ